jgi:uncharacterized protein (TIRG00374 family)
LNPTVKNILKGLLFLSIAVFLVWLIVRPITPEQWKNIKLAASNANYYWIGLSLGLGVISHIMRAIRWRMLIEAAPDSPKPGLANTFCSVMIGYMANYALPRLGEVSRCGVLSRYEKLSFAELIGTVIVERGIDLLMMFLLFLIMMLLSFNKVYSIVKTKALVILAGKWDSLKHINPIIPIAIAIILIGGGWFLYKKKDHLFGFAKKFINNFLEGIKSVGHLKKPFQFWFYSFAIWVLYLFMLYVCFFSTEATSHLTLSDAIVVMVFGTIGVIFTNGGLGAYQLLVIYALTHIYLVAYEHAFTFAWIVWSSQLILIVFLGIVSLLLLPIINRSKE